MKKIQLIVYSSALLGINFWIGWQSTCPQLNSLGFKLEFVRVSVRVRNVN